MKKQVRIGPLVIGGTFPVRVESMLKVPLSQEADCLKQCLSLAAKGCELVRVAFPSLDLVEELRRLNRDSPVPLMADIHFDPGLALAALEAGIPSIRINPGNMARTRLKDVVRCARERKAVIRIGANGGSLNSKQLAAAKGVQSDALFAAVEEQLNLLLSEGFGDIILSAKSSSVADTIRANEMLATRHPAYPLHIGITESGSGVGGLVKSTAGLAILLGQGIGDTLRVSLTEPPEAEVEAGFSLLRALELRKKGINIISCPTCGRSRINVRKLLDHITPFFARLPDGVTVAVMGCEVNGPREARHADLGIAGTASGAVIFRKGKVLRDAALQDIPSIIEEFAAEIGENRADQQSNPYSERR